MLAGVLPRLATALSQPAVLAAGVATGIGVGAVGVGTGAIPVTDPAPRLVALYECPDSARVVMNLPGNQNVLVTARTADGAWLQIYIGEAAAERGWARAASLQLKAAPDTLPIEDCTPEATSEPTLEPPTVLPSPVASEAPFSAGPSGVPATELPPAPSPTPSRTPSPTKTPGPTKTPTPTPTPLTGPVLFNVDLYAPAQEGDGVYRTYYRDQYACPYAWNNVALTVESDDAQGTASVTIYFRPTNGTTGSIPMSDENGLGTLWDGGFDAQEAWAVGPLELWLQGTDADGNKGPILDLGDLGYEIEVGSCISNP
jgi:hypothetical protein